MKKAVIVTGGSSKIGRKLALALAHAGLDLFLIYNNGFSIIKETQSAVHSLTTAKCVIKRLDLRNTALCGAVVDEALNEFPHCSILINGASIFSKLGFLDTSWEFLEENIKIHLLAPFALSQKLIQRCEEKKIKAKIINIIDDLVVHKKSAFFAYIVSKTALSNMSELTDACEALYPKPMTCHPEHTSYLSSLSQDGKTSIEEFIEELVKLCGTTKV